MDSTSINAEGTGYRRGVIFGLTMAEVLLLLIFCLLLFLKLINDQKDEAEKKRDELLAQNQTLEEKNQNLERDMRTLEAYLQTMEPRQNQSSFVQQVQQSATLLEIYNPEKTEELTTLLKNNPRAFEELKLSTEDEWAELTTKSQFTVKEEIYDVISSLSDKQLQNLMDNAPIAANNTLSELVELTTKPEPKPAPPKEYRHTLSELVSVDQLEKLVAEKLVESENNWPPIISLPEAESFSFEIGSAQLTDGFKQQLGSDIANQILQVLNDYQADVIEVIGHTDLQPMNQAIRTTNLDAESQKFFISDRDIDLRAKDNAGLGYARALSVTKQLKKIPELSGYTILPYSAAQMISPDETINLDPDAFESSQLRRIEIRVRRKNSE